MLIVSTEGNSGIFDTVQGEGKLTGYPSVFIRLSQCNLRCQWRNPDGSFTTCDTPHTSFEPETSNKMSVDEIVEKILAIDCDHVVVTGGEPYFQKEVTEIIDRLHESGKHVTVETNGTIYRKSKADLVSISLKLESSSTHPELGQRHNKNRLNYQSLLQFIQSSPDFQFKFVINDIQDVHEILTIRNELEGRSGIKINDRIWVMPQGISVSQLDDKMLWLVDLCKTYKWKLTDRMHLRIWGHAKGV